MRNIDDRHSSDNANAAHVKDTLDNSLEAERSFGVEANGQQRQDIRLVLYVTESDVSFVKGS